MGRILRLYAIREIVLPTLLAIFTITFILMIRFIYERDVIELLLQPGVSALQVFGVLASSFPSVFIFALPMAVLIGVLIGVGRMTMDREILAIRASGINLLSVFVPAMIVSFLCSLMILWLSISFVPSRMHDAMSRIDQLKVALANSLDAGRFHEKLPGFDGVLYFRERTPDNKLLGMIVETQKNVLPKDKRAKEAAKIKSTAKSDGSTSAATNVKITTDALLLPRQSELTLVFAESGEISATPTEDAEGDSAQSELSLTLHNGSIHQLSGEAARPDYVVINFDQLRRRMFDSSAIESMHLTLGSGELLHRINDAKTKEKDKAAMRKELWQRRSLWLATFVFVLVGIPLSIWVRPSGKSWGILIAIVLMLVYYVVLQMGLTLVKDNRPAGIAMALMPNLLFAVLGGYLWWRTLRS